MRKQIIIVSAVLVITGMILVAPAVPLIQWYDEIEEFTAITHIEVTGAHASLQWFVRFANSTFQPYRYFAIEDYYGVGCVLNITWRLYSGDYEYTLQHYILVRSTE